MLIAWLRQLLAPGLSRSGDVEKWTGLPYLGSIPRAKLPATELNPSAAVVEYDDPALAAAFRNIHAAFLHLCPQVQVVALSSALPKDGKTTCSVALARQSALCGYKTVLVDCDLRRRSASAELDHPPAVGLLQVIAGEVTLEQGLSRDGFTHLYVLPIIDNIPDVQHATAQDVLGSARMGALVSSLRKRFEYIFIDTPPVLAVVDTRRLAPLVDTFLFVTQWRRTPRRAVKLAVDLLKGTGAPVAGLVLTCAPFGAVSATIY
jgi:succinoglycan biosynthesis transport protein ExoP